MRTLILLSLFAFAFSEDAASGTPERDRLISEAKELEGQAETEKGGKKISTLAQAFSLRQQAKKEEKKAAADKEKESAAILGNAAESPVVKGQKMKYEEWRKLSAEEERKRAIELLKFYVAEAKKMELKKITVPESKGDERPSETLVRTRALTHNRSVDEITRCMKEIDDKMETEMAKRTANTLKDYISFYLETE